MSSVASAINSKEFMISCNATGSQSYICAFNHVFQAGAYKDIALLYVHSCAIKPAAIIYSTHITLLAELVSFSKVYGTAITAGLEFVHFTL